MQFRFLMTAREYSTHDWEHITLYSEIRSVVRQVTALSLLLPIFSEGIVNVFAPTSCAPPNANQYAQACFAGKRDVYAYRYCRYDSDW
jgi:hypothetical protein